METGQRPACRGVIKLAVRPKYRIVALLARRWEASLHVVDRCRGVIEVLLMTADARRIGRREVVIVVDVALRTLRAGQVEASERPARRRVIELGIGPVRRTVTLLTRGREAQLDMVHRRCCRVVILLVAADAGRAAQCVIVVDVAHHARHRRIRVETCEGEANCAVVEICRSPSRCRVALLAVGRESRPGMHGIIGLLKISLVARNAGRVSCAEIVVVVRVAAGTGNRGVHAREWESRSRVIELGVQPIIESVALLAICWKLARRVIWIACLIEVGRMAAVAVG